MNKKRLNEKIKEKTGLPEGLIIFYKYFIESSNLSDGICMFGEIEYKINQLMERGGSKKHDTKTYYEFLYKEFKEKKLIEDYKSPSGTIYPKIIGYNYLNDPEFYFAFRKKDEENWNGRSTVDKQIQHNILRHLSYNEEIREKEFLKMLLN